MKKYSINGDTHNEITVEASSYSIKDDYFHFVDEEGTKVFSMAVQQVVTVQRIDA